MVALDDVSLALSAGSFTAVMGPSGSGKSTFLHVAAGLDRPTAGSVRLAGQGSARSARSRAPSCAASQLPTRLALRAKPAEAIGLRE